MCAERSTLFMCKPVGKFTLFRCCQRKQKIKSGHFAPGRTRSSCAGAHWSRCSRCSDQLQSCWEVRGDSMCPKSMMGNEVTLVIYDQIQFQKLFAPRTQLNVFYHFHLSLFLSLSLYAQTPNTHARTHSAVTFNKFREKRGLTLQPFPHFSINDKRLQNGETLNTFVLISDTLCKRRRHRYFRLFSRRSAVGALHRQLPLLAI